MSTFLSSGSSIDISKAPVLPVTLSLFLPLAFSMMISSTVGLVDMYVASFLGTEAQAAVGLGDQLLFLVIVLGTGLATACSSFVSRAAGARDFFACNRFAKLSLVLASCAGLFSTVMGMICARPILNLLGASAEVTVLAEPYTVFNAIANTPFVVSLCLSAIFRALGRTRLSLYLWLITALLSNVITMLLFFSGIPELKSLNALAIGWDLGALLGCICGLIFYKEIFTASPFSCSGAKCSNCKLHRSGDVDADSNFWSIMKDLLYVAAPAVLSELSLIVSHFLMYRLFADSPDSTTLQAAWTIKLKLEEMFALIPLMALSMSTAVIVGQSIGAGSNERALKAALGISIAAGAVMLLVGTLLSVFASNLASSFCSDPRALAATTQLLAPSPVILPLTAFSCIFCAAMEGAGLTQGPMMLNLIFQVLARFGLAFYFGFQLSMNLAGVGIGICAAQLLMLVAIVVYGKIRLKSWLCTNYSLSIE